jgi:aminopeptidase N
LTVLPTASAAPAAIDGALTSQDSLLPQQGNGGYDVSHYDIDLTFRPSPAGGVVAGCLIATGQPSPAGTITATTTITATAPVPLRSFGLDFKGLTVNSVTVDGAAAAWRRSQNATTGAYKLVVTPASPVTGSFTVAVRYSGTPETDLFDGGADMLQGWLPNKSYCDGTSTLLAEGGFTGVGQPSGNDTWYPNNGTPDDKATYTTRLTAPNGWSAVGIGRLVAKNQLAGGQTQWVWDETMPTATFLALASFGQFTEYTTTITVDGRSIPVWAYVSPGLDQGLNSWNTLRGTLTDILNWGSQRFGPYQPNAAGYVLAPLQVGWALETQGRPLSTETFPTSVLVHEYAHQWAGNSVTVSDWSDLWMPEGFATYAEWLWAEDHGDMSAAAKGQLTWFWQRDDSVYWSVAPGLPKANQLWGAWNYMGAGVAWAALRSGVGDAVFDQIVKTWLARYQNSNCSTAQFMALAEQISGRDLSRWQKDWLDTAAKPRYWPDTTTFPVDPLAWAVNLTALFNQIFQQLSVLLMSLVPIPKL